MEVNQNKTIDNTVRYTQIVMGFEKICFMFSGSSYNYDRPLFYYATMAMLQNYIDVVHIHYSYDKDFYNNSIDEITRIMMQDLHPIIEEVLKNGHYNEIFFLGKSLGTIPIIKDFMKREEFSKSKIILFTPLLKFDTIFDSILSTQHQGLLVIGDKDPHFDLNQINSLRKTNLNVHVVEDANHPLDVGEFHTTKSILALSEIMEKLQTIIQE